MFVRDPDPHLQRHLLAGREPIHDVGVVVQRKRIFAGFGIQRERAVRSFTGLHAFGVDLACARAGDGARQVLLKTRSSWVRRVKIGIFRLLFVKHRSCKRNIAPVLHTGFRHLKIGTGRKNRRIVGAVDLDIDLVSAVRRRTVLIRHADMDIDVHSIAVHEPVEGRMPGHSSGGRTRNSRLRC